MTNLSNSLFSKSKTLFDKSKLIELFKFIFEGQEDGVRLQSRREIRDRHLRFLRHSPRFHGSGRGSLRHPSVLDRNCGGVVGSVLAVGQTVRTDTEPPPRVLSNRATSIEDLAPDDALVHLDCSGWLHHPPCPSGNRGFRSNHHDPFLHCKCHPFHCELDQDWT